MNMYIPMNNSRQLGLNTRHPLNSFRNEIDGIFGSLLSKAGCDKTTTAAFTPKLDIVEDEKHFLVTAELPGLTEEDIDITIEDEILTISGEKNNKIEREDNGKYYSERTFGSFERQLKLGEHINTEDVSAKFSNGILTISLAKLEEEKKKLRKVEVKSE